MTLQQQPESRAAYIHPIDCKCGRSAMLVRTVLRPVGELHIFQCYQCRELIEESSEP